MSRVWVLALIAGVFVAFPHANAQTEGSIPDTEGVPPESGVSGDSPGAADTSGWDWGSFEVMDDTPKVKGQASTQSQTDVPVDATKPPKVTETTEPDFEAEAQLVHALFPDAPVFSVIPSKRDRDMHPCANCHTWTKSDPTPRPLKPPHDNFQLSHGLHGKGKFWCFTCHTLEGQGGLRTLEGQTLDFSEAYVLCSQCHARQARDWVFGVHGKRVDNWQGERRVYNCTVCHYQHRPAPRPRAPLAGPNVRQDLERPAHWVPKSERDQEIFHSKPLWEARVDGKVSGSGP